MKIKKKKKRHFFDDKQDKSTSRFLYMHVEKWTGGTFLPVWISSRYCRMSLLSQRWQLCQVWSSLLMSGFSHCPLLPGKEEKTGAQLCRKLLGAFGFSAKLCSSISEPAIDSMQDLDVVKSFELLWVKIKCIKLLCWLLRADDCENLCFKLWFWKGGERITNIWQLFNQTSCSNRSFSNASGLCAYFRFIPQSHHWYSGGALQEFNSYFFHQHIFFSNFLACLTYYEYIVESKIYQEWDIHFWHLPYKLKVFYSHRNPSILLRNVTHKKRKPSTFPTKPFKYQL